MAKQRPASGEIAMGAGFDVRVREPNNQAVFGMKFMVENDCFQGGALAPDESKFEKAEIGSLRETKVCAHFGRKLQKIFPLPSNSSEPENVRILLRKIQAKLDKLLVPEDG
jgi:hypothetical protein